MAEGISIQPEPIATPQPQTKPQVLKYVLFAILGLLLLGGSTYTGYWYGIKNEKLKMKDEKPLVSPAGGQPKTENLTPTEIPTVILTPTPDPTTNWKTYTNSKYRFSFKYPSTWTTPENEPGDPNTITSKGAEGSVNIHLVEYFGGACPPEYEKIQIDNRDFDTCHYIREEKVEAWEQIVKEFDTLIGSYRGLQIDAYANIPPQANRDTVLKILSTFQFLD